MQLPIRARGAVKNVLWLSRAKLVYARITLSRHTTFYFLFTIFSCLILSALQGVVVSDHFKAVNILDDIVVRAELPPHLSRVVGGWLEICNGIPQEGSTVCSRVVNLEEGSPALQQRKREILSRINRRQIQEEEASSDEGKSSDDADSVSSASEDGEVSSDEEEEVEIEEVSTELPQPTQLPPSGPQSPLTSATNTAVTTPLENDQVSSPTPTQIGNPVPTVAPSTPVSTLIPQAPVLANQQGLSPSEQCIYALSWLEDGLHDAQREDAVIIFSQLWMLTIGIASVLNESLPHLGAAFFAHLLTGAWAASRIQSTKEMSSLYRNVIVPGACNGQDFLGRWWEARLAHTVPIVVVHILGILALGFFSWKLYKIYATQPFSRVGASPVILRMYKVLTFFSVMLQVSTFFSIASAAMWINKMTHGSFMIFAKHWKIYTAVFVIFMLLVIPWLFLGWKCMRKECKKQLFAFFVISILLVTISSVMFASALYRTIFLSWSFFATVTVTSFVLLILTVLLGVLCRLNFNKGLSNYLDVSDALEGADFTPVKFTQDYDKGPESNWPENDWNNENGNGLDGWPTTTTMHTPQVSVPEKSYYGIQVGSPQDNPFLAPQELVRKFKGTSVYSDMTRSPIHLSSTPPVASSQRSSLEITISAHKYPSDTGSNFVMDYYGHTNVDSQVRPSNHPSVVNGDPTSGLELSLSPFSAVWNTDVPQLVIANPSATRDSMITEASIPYGVLPPIPIPTNPAPTRSLSGRAMVSPFPVVSRRSLSAPSGNKF